MRVLAYAFACLIVPTLWALAVVWLVEWLERRRPPVAPLPPRRDELPPPDYMI